MNIVESILTNNPCYKTGKKIIVKGIMLESVRCPQPSAKVFVHNWNRESCDNRCVHAFVDANSGDIYQTLPWNHRGRHCGKHPETKITANNTHIGIKLCEPAQIKYRDKTKIELIGSKDIAIAAARRVYTSTVDLVAKLCIEFGLNPKKDVISQQEGYNNGISATYGDPVEVWKLLGLNYTMDSLRADVEKAMKKIPVKKAIVMNDEKPAMVNLDETKSEEAKAQLVRIGVDNLRIRSGPFAGDNTTGKYTGKGVFAITEIQNGSGSKSGWGKLRNGAGWISMDYVELL